MKIQEVLYKCDKCEKQISTHGYEFYVHERKLPEDSLFHVRDTDYRHLCISCYEFFNHIFNQHTKK